MNSYPLERYHLKHYPSFLSVCYSPAIHTQPAKASGPGDLLHFLHIPKGLVLVEDSTNNKTCSHEVTLITRKPIQIAELKRLTRMQRHTISKSVVLNQVNVLFCTITKIIEDYTGRELSSLISTWLWFSSQSAAETWQVPMQMMADLSGGLIVYWFQIYLRGLQSLK